MTEITPETPVAATPPTVDLVAGLLTEADNELHDGYDWKLHLGAFGNVVQIGIEPFADDGTRLPEMHYRAVVVPGEQVPLVLDRERYRARVEEIVKAFSTTLAASIREMYPYHLARLKGALWALAETGEPLIDPDCRDGKCGSCVGGPCEHDCHQAGSGGVA